LILCGPKRLIKALLRVNLNNIFHLAAPRDYTEKKQKCALLAADAAQRAPRVYAKRAAFVLMGEKTHKKGNFTAFLKSMKLRRAQ
jgi:hypothetical protein